MKPTILLTGATGYIGSHTWLALEQAGHAVVGDAGAMDAVFTRHRTDAVVHFAAFKAVGESTARPLDCYANNVGGLLTVCRAMQLHGVQRFVFSSSATVYGAPASLPIRETAALSATSPCGRTKLIGETILRDLGSADPSWQTACLRYFNPVGAHDSGRMDEDPHGTPNNLMPHVAQVVPGGPPAGRRRGGVLCRPVPGAAAARVADTARPGPHVRRQLALAVAESARL